MGSRAVQRFAGNTVAALLAAASIYGGRNDLATAARDAIGLVTDHPVSALLLLAAAVIAVVANLDWLRWSLGLGLSNAQWVERIRTWTLEQRQWEIARYASNKKGFHIVFRVAGRNGEVLVQRPDGSDTVVLRMDIQVDRRDRERLLRLTEDALLDMRDDLRIALAMMPVDFDLETDRDRSLITDVHIWTGFRADMRPSEMEFMGMLRVVFAAFMAAVTIIGRNARKAPDAPMGVGQQGDET